MNYFYLLSELKKTHLTLFTLRDIENLFPHENLKTIKNNLVRWVREGRFIKLKRDVYEFVEPGLERSLLDLYVANRLYSPSYISLETALSLYEFIPDIAVQVTSLTTRPTRTFKNKYGTFFYRSCQKKAFTGYQLMTYSGEKILIADPEKALVDFIYFRTRQDSFLNFKEERLNILALQKLKWTKLHWYAELFNDKTKRTLKSLKEWTKC